MNATPILRLTRPPRRGRLLVVDKDPVIGVSFERELGTDHHVVVVTSGLRDALDRIQNEDFDVILCDLSAPDMIGMKVLAGARSVAPRVADRIVFMTQGSLTEIATSFLGTTQNARFSKPVSFAVVRELLSGRLR